MWPATGFTIYQMAVTVRYCYSVTVFLLNFALTHQLSRYYDNKKEPILKVVIAGHNALFSLKVLLKMKILRLANTVVIFIRRPIVIKSTSPIVDRLTDSREDHVGIICQITCTSCDRSMVTVHKSQTFHVTCTCLMGILLAGVVSHISSTS